VRLRAAHPCALSRSTVHPEHKRFLLTNAVAAASSRVRQPIQITPNKAFKQEYLRQNITRVIGSGRPLLDILFVVSNILKFTIDISLRLVVEVR